jgi:tetratricopeptide (TPR) repeat protein
MTQSGRGPAGFTCLKKYTMPSLRKNLMSKRLKEEDINFEIAFYNGLIEKHANFVEALVVLGDLYTKIGKFKEGLAVDEKLVQLRPDDPVVLYNLACSYSLLGEIDKAFRAFKKAVNRGYMDFFHLEQDADLKNLRQDKRFQQYLQRIKNKKSSPGEE